MTRATLAGYMHIDGWDTFERQVFNRRKLRAGFRKAGRIVATEAEMAIRLARGANDYPATRTGRLLKSIKPKVSRSGFMVKVAPTRTSDMADYYPAYLHYGVRGRAGGWRIKPRANYMVNALEDSTPRVRTVLQQAFASALFN